MTNRMHMRRTLAIALSLVALALTGCSSRPESKDIETALGDAYECPALEVKGVKKIDGEPGPQGSYDVAFEYTVAFKGGDAGGIKLMSDWLNLASESVAISKALIGFDRQVPATDPRKMRISAYQTQVGAELEKLIPCAGPQIDAIVRPLLDAGKEALTGSTGAVGVPIGVHVVRTGRMVRSESGWYFKVLTAGFNAFDVVTSRPVAFALPASKVPQLLGADAVQGAGAGEQTLTGVLRKGLTDSCFAVTVGGAETCYSLPGDADQVQRILTSCGDGDACAVTGTFDDKAESLGAVSKVEKASR
jgi:hypothetical protein